MTIKLRYAEPLMKEVIAYYIRREYMGKCIWLFVLAVLLPLTDFVVADFWYSVFTALPAFALLALFVFGYQARIQDSLKKLAALDDGKVTLTLGEATVSTESEIGKSEVKWKMFTELWECRSAYLLVFTNRHFLTLPKDQVTHEAIAFIRAHLKPSRA